MDRRELRPIVRAIIIDVSVSVSVGIGVGIGINVRIGIDESPARQTTVLFLSAAHG